MPLLNNNVKLVGCDIFIFNKDGIPKLPETAGVLKPTIISNRGTKVWPGPTPDIHLTDVHRCRFLLAAEPGKPIQHQDVLKAIGEIEAAGLEWVHVEKLLEINGQAGFSKAQGE